MSKSVVGWVSAAAARRLVLLLLRLLVLLLMLLVSLLLWVRLRMLLELLRMLHPAVGTRLAGGEAPLEVSDLTLQGGERGFHDGGIGGPGAIGTGNEREHTGARRNGGVRDE